MELKDRYEDYTELEFLGLIKEFFDSSTSLEGDEYSRYISKLSRHFEMITEHPRKNGVIFHPDPGVEDSPAGVLKAVKEWRAANGKPGLKVS